MHGVTAVHIYHNNNDDDVLNDTVQPSLRANPLPLAPVLQVGRICFPELHILPIQSRNTLALSWLTYNEQEKSRYASTLREIIIKAAKNKRYWGGNEHANMVLGFGSEEIMMMPLLLLW